MKRSKENNGAKKEAKEYAQLELYKDFEIEDVSETTKRYHIGKGVYLDVCDGKDSDYGCLNIFGVVVKVSYREISKGERAGEVFISYPQYKKKDGEYAPFVTNYNKELNKAIKDVLAYIYG